MRMRTHEPALEAYLCEELVSSCLNLCRAMLGDGFRAEHIDLAYPAPPYAVRYAELLGTDVRFDARTPGGDRTRMAGATDARRQPGRGAPDGRALPGADAIATAASQDRRRHRTTAARCRWRNPPRLTDIAAELHLTERTLRRHLRAAGTSFRALHDGVRERTAPPIAGRRPPVDRPGGRRDRVRRRARLPPRVQALDGPAAARNAPAGQCRRGSRPEFAQPSTISASTSNTAPFGSAGTSMVERAGYGARSTRPSPR